jgi:hypothetical protein
VNYQTTLKGLNYNQANALIEFATETFRSSGAHFTAHFKEGYAIAFLSLNELTPEQIKEINHKLEGFAKGFNVGQATYKSQ